MRRFRNHPLSSAAGLVLASALLVACGDGDASRAGGGAGAAGHAAPGSGESLDAAEAVERQAVHLSAEQERALGVVYVTVTRETLTRSIRTVGRIAAPEPNVADVTPKIEGFVEELFVASTGETVRRGQKLLTLYSPELVAAQEELLTARRLVADVDSTAREAWRSAGAMLEAARRRLAYWDITPEQIDRLESTSEVTKTLTLVAPVSGIVLEKDVFEGQRVMPGRRLYRIADLTEVWVEGEVFEQDIKFVEEGAQAHIEVAAYPGEHEMGMVSFVYPTVDVQSRTNRVRVTVPNRDLRLKPGMFATIFFDVQVADDALTVPMEAVVVTGERNLVFSRGADGTLQAREVVLGARAGERIAILSGLSEGERIVGSANFLVDAESRLGGAEGMPGTQHAGHGSVLEPESTGADRSSDTTEEADKQGGAEHDHD
jgi:Cu(I)/Ag(I) efflux system membrane fusion protein